MHSNDKNKNSMEKELRIVTVKDIRKLTDTIEDTVYDICYITEHVENKINKGIIKALAERFPEDIAEYKSLYEHDGVELLNWVERFVDDKKDIPVKYFQMYEIIFNYDKICNNDFWYAYEEEID